jgi:hypothetical protein
MWSRGAHLTALPGVQQLSRLWELLTHPNNTDWRSI